MEMLTNKGVSCFLHKSNKYRRYYVKKDKNVCWRCTNKACKAKIETRDGTVEEFGFHCHVETIDSKCQCDCSTHGVQEKSVRTRHGSPVITNGAESYHGHLNAEFNAPHPNIYIFVEILLRQQATYVTVSSLSKSRTISRSIAYMKNPFAYTNFLQTPD